MSNSPIREEIREERKWGGITLTGETAFDSQKLFAELEKHDYLFFTGKPEISDIEYDHLCAEARSVEPNHPYFNKVGYKVVDGSIAHIIPMLSTEKAYSYDEVSKWIAKVEKARESLNYPSTQIKCTPKLDGVAACYDADNRTLATRNDGGSGANISQLLDLNLTIIGDASQSGAGEIVVNNDFFNKYLSEHFANPLSAVAGLVTSQTPNRHLQFALSQGAIELVLFKDLDCAQFIDIADATSSNLEALELKCREIGSRYAIDGVVFEIANEMVKNQMGTATTYHRWQIAKKVRGEDYRTIVTDIIFQIGRTGKHSPVLCYNDVIMKGATHNRATAHHCGSLLVRGIGIGSEISVTKSGEIIPFVTQVHTHGEPAIPTHCLCCETELVWSYDKESKNPTFLTCPNEGCESRIERSIIHHFKTLKINGFGDKTVKKLVDKLELTTLSDVYSLTLNDYLSAGVGIGDATNLITDIKKATTSPMPDYLLLGSLGIGKLGRGSSKKLLAVHRIDTLKEISRNDILSIKDFGNVTSDNTFMAMQTTKGNDLSILLENYQSIIHTQDAAIEAQSLLESSTSSLAGKRVVFTGKCSKGRDDMGSEAESYGLIHQKRVTADTDILVYGEKAGETKLQAARNKGVTVITEADYRQQL
ncbi:hypothetical protein [Vibrio breoganii]|nr:hypothetical protein [Vibrio breoganii]